MRKISDNPPTRFPARAIVESGAPWFIAHVKPRQEKAAADDCLRLGIEYYLPMVVHVTRRKDNNKPRKSVLPLFPGYISCAGNKETHSALYATGRIAHVISVKNQKKFIGELNQIYSLLEQGVFLEPCLAEIPQGAEVCIQAGPLKGIRGVVANAKNQNRLILSVEGLGRAMLTVDAAMVRPVVG